MAQTHFPLSFNGVNLSIFLAKMNGGGKVKEYQRVQLRLRLSILLFWLEKKARNTLVLPRRPAVFETHEKWQSAQRSPSEVSGCLIFTYFS